MALRIDDRWLWLSLGVFTFFAAKGVAYGLREIVRLTEVTEHPDRLVQDVQGVQQAPQASSEDAIKTESLETLATCSNVEIRKAATKILCDRLMNNRDARKLIVEDFNSSDSERQEQAIKVLKLLDCYGMVTDWYHACPQLSDLPFRSDYFRALPIRGARARAHEESPEEQALRRRRREAMVLNEGDRPVSQDDIIQQGGRMTDVEARMAEHALATLARTGTEDSAHGDVSSELSQPNTIT
ncbi:hypothetical protein K432DRAFT_404168 [Lepidopterella palustris CBS 459.81]|uniref:Uncharacterized protein n=1 Tax=Lepidopterella palustris CBS 459.81 TaxID=1314670 RepID=A0A8E2JG05_9PEZI|nr:hypothetical protein K432DRAFT_404168 [Lepidopterella palustris CBS 459.81]